MFKKASRFQQRLGIMIGSGMFTRAPAPTDDNGKRLSPIEQAHLKQRLRLARIRRAFVIETQIALYLDQGRNVAALREELAKVKSGEIKVPLSLAKDPRTSPDFVGVTSARKTGPALAPHNPRRAPRPNRKPTLTASAVEGALKDLAKSKLTLESISIGKVMLDSFDIAEVSGALSIPEAYLQKLRVSAVYQSAPTIPPQEALVIVDVLEKQLATRFERSAGQKEHAPGTELMGSTPVATTPITPAIVPPMTVTTVKTVTAQSAPVLIDSTDFEQPQRRSTLGNIAPRLPHPEPLADVQDRLKAEFDKLETLFDRRGALLAKLQRHRETIAATEQELREIDAGIDELIKDI